MVTIERLEFYYKTGNFRLTIPEFSVSSGEKIAVIGPSGSGKTTLLNLIAGIITPVSGAVNIGEVTVSELNTARRRQFRIAHIGFVFQDFELLDYLSVLDNILHPYRITSILKLDKEVKQRASELAEAMSIGDKLNRKANDLSHGEKQRTAICRALLPRPKLILADEATGNLDPENKLCIMDLLVNAVEGHKATLLAVTHDYDLLEHFDRVVNFKDFRN